jgi:hypothetical protein
MPTLHTFGCSITQGFSLPDVITPKLNDQGVPLTKAEVKALGDAFDWSEVYLDKPSKFAWPVRLAEMIDMPVVNHARRGACFQQITRQCASAGPTIKEGDVVIIMWTYLSRVSIQWPARTAVPWTNIVEPNWGWRTVVTGFNKLFGLERSKASSPEMEEHIQKYLHDSSKYTYLDPLGVFNRYYNNLSLQVMTDGYIRSLGAEVLHLSVEPEASLVQLEVARKDLDVSLREPWVIDNPGDWYTLEVDHTSSQVIHDLEVEKAEGNTHPSVEHHENFARHIYTTYFKEE